jgi:uncharacterized protein
MISFNAYGHENILSTHRNTLEITKDTHLTKRGDCVVAVNADFSPSDIKKLLGSSKAKLVIEVGSIKDEVNFEINPNFKDEKEIVIRKTGFVSDRTLGINADKAACDLKRELIKKLACGAKASVSLFCAI